MKDDCQTNKPSDTESTSNKLVEAIDEFNTSIDKDAKRFLCVFGCIALVGGAIFANEMYKLDKETKAIQASIDQQLAGNSTPSVPSKTQDDGSSRKNLVWVTPELACRKAIQTNLKDPGSFRRISQQKGVNAKYPENWWLVTINYSAKNSFGAQTREVVQCAVGPDNTVRDMWKSY